MKLRKGRNSKATCLVAIFLVVITLVTMAVVYTAAARAHGKADPPNGLFGNPNDFRAGPLNSIYIYQSFYDYKLGMF